MLVNIPIQLVNTARKRLDEYLYKNEELDCCIKDMIAADGYYEVKEYFANEKLLKEIMTAAGQYGKGTEITTYNTVTREYFITNDIIAIQ